MYPNDGGYSGDEEIFLNSIINTIEGALKVRDEIDSGALDNWIRKRRAQVEGRELVYIAHQLDLLAQVP